MKFINSKNLIEFGIIVTFTILLILIPSIDLKGYYNSTISSKSVFFQAAMCFSLYLLVLRSLLYGGSIAYSVNALDFVILAFVLYVTVNRYFLQEIVSHSIRYSDFIWLICFYFILRIFNRNTQLFLLYGAVLGALIQAIIGLLQLFDVVKSNHALFKVTGSFFNPGPYAGFVAVGFIISLGLYLFKDRLLNEIFKPFKWREWIANFLFEYLPLATILSSIAILPSTQSRSAWLAVSIAAILLFFMRYNLAARIQNYKVLTRILMISGFLICVLSVGFGLYQFKKDSANGRILVWNVTKEIIKDHPLIGVGFDNFKSQYMSYQGQFFVDHAENDNVFLADNTFYAFNEILQLGAENGLISVIILFLITGLLLWFLKNQKAKVESIVAFAGILSYFVIAMFSYPNEILPTKILLVLIIGLIGSNCSKPLYTKRIIFKPIFNSLALTIIVGISTYQLIIRSNEFKAMNEANKSYQSAKYERCIEICNANIEGFMKNNGEMLLILGKSYYFQNQYDSSSNFLREASKFSNSTIVQNSIGDSYKALGDIDSAVKHYTQADQMIPARIYSKYLLAKMYQEYGQYKIAKGYANKILNHKVKINNRAAKEIRWEMKKMINKYSQTVLE